MVPSRQSSDHDKPYVRLHVDDPQISGSIFFGDSATFCIKIETNHPSFSLTNSEVRRSYKDFTWLRRVLKQHHPERNPPTLLVGAWWRTDATSLEKRCGFIQSFLCSVIKVPIYLGERALHLLLQSNLARHEIEENLLGLRDDVVEPELLLPSIDNTPEIAVDCIQVITCNAMTSSVLTEIHNLSLDEGYGTSDSASPTGRHSYLQNLIEKEVTSEKNTLQQPPEPSGTVSLTTRTLQLC